MELHLPLESYFKILEKDRIVISPDVRLKCYALIQNDGIELDGLGILLAPLLAKNSSEQELVIRRYEEFIQGVKESVDITKKEPHKFAKSQLVDPSKPIKRRFIFILLGVLAVLIYWVSNSLVNSPLQLDFNYNEEKGEITINPQKSILLNSRFLAYNVRVEDSIGIQKNQSFKIPESNSFVFSTQRNRKYSIKVSSMEGSEPRATLLDTIIQTSGIAELADLDATYSNYSPTLVRIDQYTRDPDINPIFPTPGYIARTFLQYLWISIPLFLLFQLYDRYKKWEISKKDSIIPSFDAPYSIEYPRKEMDFETHPVITQLLQSLFARTIFIGKNIDLPKTIERSSENLGFSPLCL